MAEIPVGILKFPNGQIVGETEIVVQYKDPKSGANGPKTDKGIDLLSYSFSGSTAGSGGGVGGFAGGKVQLQLFHFSKKTDMATPKLFEFMCLGKNIDLVHFVVLRAATQGGDEGSNLDTYYAYAFTNVTIASFNTGGSPGDDGRSHEDVSFAFERFDYLFGLQTPSGTQSLKAFYNQKTQEGG